MTDIYNPYGRHMAMLLGFKENRNLEYCTRCLVLTCECILRSIKTIEIPTVVQFLFSPETDTRSEVTLVGSSDSIRYLPITAQWFCAFEHVGQGVKFGCQYVVTYVLFCCSSVLYKL